MQRSPSVPLSRAAFTTLSLLAIALVLAHPAGAQLAPGDILLSNGPSVQRYKADGTLVSTYSGNTSTSGNYSGTAINAAGNIVTSYRGRRDGGGGILIYSPSGTRLTTFTTPRVGFAGDLSLFADGTIAISDQINSAVRLYSQTGSFVRSLTATGMISPFGSVVAPDNSLFVADYDANKLFRFSQTGTSLGIIELNFGPGDLAISPVDGTFFVSDTGGGNIVQMTMTGTVLNTFSSGFTSDFNGIGISNDGTTIFATGGAGTKVRKLSSTNGALLGEFTLASGGAPAFMTVVPVAKSAVAAPEPGELSIMGMLGTSVCGLMIRARRKARNKNANATAQVTLVKCKHSTAQQQKWPRQDILPGPLLPAQLTQPTSSDRLVRVP